MEQKASILHQTQTINIKENLVNIVLLSVYLIITIPVLFLMNSDPKRTHWSYVAVFLSFYAIIAILIWINRQNLADFHIDRLYVVTFILFGTLLRVRNIDNSITLVLELMFFPIAIILAIKLWRGKVPLIAFRKSQYIWLGIAVLLGYAFSFLVLFIGPWKFTTLTSDHSKSNLGFIFLAEFFIQIGSTGIYEEAIFRGFLWGTLRKMGFKETHILIFQAFLFWITHFSTWWNSRYKIWFILPMIVGLILGFLAWKSKSLIPPIIAHVLFNAYIAVYNAMKLG